WRRSTWSCEARARSSELASTASRSSAWPACPTTFSCSSARGPGRIGWSSRRTRCCARRARRDSARSSSRCRPESRGRRRHRPPALRFLGSAPGRFDLVLVDPPYDSAVRLAGPLSKRLPAVLTDKARIVTESDKRAPLELSLPLERERVYGDTRIAIHRA